MRKPLTDYLATPYPFNVEADPDGGYFVSFPDLPGCMTQVMELNEIGPAAAEIRELWIETEYERGGTIPPPSVSADYSGRFVLRIPRTLHRSLARSAEREGVSLNQYASALLARGDATANVERRLDHLCHRLDAIHEGLRSSVPAFKAGTSPRTSFEEPPEADAPSGSRRRQAPRPPRRTRTAPIEPAPSAEA